MREVGVVAMREVGVVAMREVGVVAMREVGVVAMRGHTRLIFIHIPSLTNSVTWRTKFTPPMSS